MRGKTSHNSADMLDASRTRTQACASRAGPTVAKEPTEPTVSAGSETLRIKNGNDEETDAADRGSKEQPTQGTGEQWSRDSVPARVNEEEHAREMKALATSKQEAAAGSLDEARNCRETGTALELLQQATAEYQSATNWLRIANEQFEEGNYREVLATARLAFIKTSEAEQLAQEVTEAPDGLIRPSHTAGENATLGAAAILDRAESKLTVADQALDQASPFATTSRAVAKIEAASEEYEKATRKFDEARAHYDRGDPDEVIHIARAALLHAHLATNLASEMLTAHLSDETENSTTTETNR